MPKGTEFIHKAIVIGAGITGLSAARKLQDNGIKPLVLESNNRIGGRLNSVNFADGSIVDLGASWIHGVDHNPIEKIAEEHNIQTRKTEFNDSDFKQTKIHSAIYDIVDKGHRLTKEEKDDLIKIAISFESELFDLAKKNDQDKLNLKLSVKECFETFCKDRGIKDDSTVYRRLLYFILVMFMQEYCLDLKDLAFNSEWPYEASATKGDNVIFPNGYIQIADVLAEGLDINLDQRVKLIDATDPNKIKIETETGEVYFCETLINTMPLGVLKSNTITFIPELPKDQKEAISTLEMGVYNKHYLYFEENFWDNKNDGDYCEWLGNISENMVKSEQMLDFMNFQKYLNKPVLLVFSSASLAKEMETWSDQKVNDYILDQLRQMYGDVVPDKPKDYLFTKWGKNPNAYGSFLSIPKGASLDLMKKLGRPFANKRIIFAGEHTSPDRYATVDGGYKEGERAANKVMKLVQQQDKALNQKNEQPPLPFSFKNDKGEKSEKSEKSENNKIKENQTEPPAHFSSARAKDEPGIKLTSKL